MDIIPTSKGKLHWPGGSAIKQSFPFPDTIIYYATMNPSSPKCYSKMIQICKYFFEKNPVLVVRRIDEEHICSNIEKCTDSKCCVTTDVTKTSSKFWFDKKLMLFCIDPNFIFIRPKIYRCDISQLGIHKATISLDNFKVLATSPKCVIFSDVKMTYNDGKVVMLENILEAIPNIETFMYSHKTDASAIAGTTIKNISKLSNLLQLCQLRLFYVSAALNLNDVIAFSKSRSDIDIQLYYHPNKISQEYKNQLEDIKKAREEHVNLSVGYENWAFSLYRIFGKNERPRIRNFLVVATRSRPPRY